MPELRHVGISFFKISFVGEKEGVLGDVQMERERQTLKHTLPLSADARLHLTTPRS